MPQAPRYDEPFYWWGPGWAPRAELGIAELLRNGTIEPACGAVLWAAMARRRSLAVIGGPSGLGKSTLLWALQELLPLDTRRLFLRGCFETFAFLADPGVEPSRSALLLNEISPHLPVYSWGPAVERALAAAERGFALLGAAHAESVTGFVALLSGSPLRIPPARIAAFELVALLEPSAAAASGRQVTSVWRLQRTRDGVAFETLYRAGGQDAGHGDPCAAGVGIGEVVSGVELRRRRALLVDLRAGVRTSLPARHSALRGENDDELGGAGRLSP